MIKQLPWRAHQERLCFLSPTTRFPKFATQEPKRPMATFSSLLMPTLSYQKICYGGSARPYLILLVLVDRWTPIITQFISLSDCIYSCGGFWENSRGWLRERHNSAGVVFTSRWAGMMKGSIWVKTWISTGD